MKTRTILFAALLGVATLAAQARAQCPRPDHLDGGPCCAPAQPTYPVPKTFRQRSLAICWRDCNPDLIQDVRADWVTDTYPPVPCKLFVMKLTIRAGATVLWAGRLTLQYSRTWLETKPTGEPIQVWRYLVNGDLRPTAAAGPIPCPVPPCAPAHNGNVRYTGYLDQVENCATGVLEWAWMLSHVCDRIDHAPPFPRAGAFHPDRSYTFVGPSAGFVVTPLLPSEPGAGPFEAVRRVTQIPGTVGLTCEFEEPINHVLNPVADLCLCQNPTSTPQWFQGDLGIFGACGTAVTTAGGPFLPGYLSMAIGFWTIPGTYPGPEQLRWNAGGYDYFDPCTGGLRPEVFFGVTTMGGYPATQLLSTGPAGPLPPIFIDQCNSLLPGGVTVMNIPFRPSDHILNLNH